jgi:hypothetical protein
VVHDGPGRFAAVRGGAVELDFCPAGFLPDPIRPVPLLSALVTI